MVKTKNFFLKTIFSFVNFFLKRRRRKTYARAKGRVLEIGCGHYGGKKELYSDQVDFVCSIDIHFPSVQRAQGDNFFSIAASAEDLPFRDNSFDSVVSFYVLCSVSDLDRSLSEIYRILKPGGKFIFCEHGIDDSGVFLNSMNRYWKLASCGCSFNRNILKHIMDSELKIVRIKKRRIMKTLFLKYEGEGAK